MSDVAVYSVRNLSLGKIVISMGEVIEVPLRINFSIHFGTQHLFIQL